MLKRLNLACARRSYLELIERAEREAWSFRDFLAALVLFFSLFQWILPNYSMNLSGRCSNWFTTVGES